MSSEDETRARVDSILNDEANTRLGAFLTQTREQLRPHVEALVEACREAYRAAAEMAGDPVTAQNEVFWQISGNLFQESAGTLDPAGPEVAALVALSKAIAASSQYEAWASTAGICRRLFDSSDGGEELGLSDDWCDVDWRDDAKRATALRKGMHFFRVPGAFHSALATVVADLMLATPDEWNYEDRQLPQPWAMCCTYVAYAIAERVKAAQGKMH